MHDAEQQRARQVALGVADLLGHEVRVLPAAVREQHRDQRRAQRDQRRRGAPCGAAPAAAAARPAPAARGQREPGEDQPASATSLRHREDVLRRRAGPDAEVVDDGEQHDRRDGERLDQRRGQAGQVRGVVGEVIPTAAMPPVSMTSSRVQP